ncbi:LysR family transcriptional regulator [Aneurinibacillus aneurinilyticus]|uniref:LysR family transcriptional regulator n=1 Tax=Aneurinibacillus aneurinilyticus TaxID=1391 RepID=UPI0023F91D70|nr:LysR family transcriptional regulator [Aneurinibacillus aneurinilyticus]MCI1695662.1 LysR family transcriptional regulator [Aneurinibacillus aneurinilyticus]
MNLEQMEYIVEVAKTGSLTQAAHNSHVTLSAISQSISSLESELGIILFTRSRGSGAIPTAEGKSIISKANEVLIKVNELREEAQSYSSTLSGKLKIATIPGPMHLLVDVVSEFKKDFPKVKIEILEKGPKEILDDIQHSKIDIGLIVLSKKLMEKHNGLSFERLLEGKMVVGVNKNSPLSLERSITPEKLINQTLVLYDDEYIREYMTNLISRYGSIDILFITNNTQAIQNAVKAGLAVTIGLDYSFINNLPYDSQDIVPIELELPNTEQVYYGWVRPKGKHSSQISKRFINRLKFEL